MMYMVRKQLYIDDRHERDLKRRARELGVSEAELVRRALDAALGDASGRRPLHPERAVAVRRLRERMRAPTSRLTGRFERDALYAERSERPERPDATRRGT